MSASTIALNLKKCYTNFRNAKCGFWWANNGKNRNSWEVFQVQKCGLSEGTCPQTQKNHYSQSRWHVANFICVSSKHFERQF